MACDDSTIFKMVVLICGVKLIQVEVDKHTRLPDFLDTLLQSDQYDLPPEIYTLTQEYKSRNLDYLTPNRPILVPNLDEVPKQLDSEQLLWLDVRVATMNSCARGTLPVDGSCINLVIEEPLSIENPRLTGSQRFFSKEILPFLGKCDIEVIPDMMGNCEECKVCPGTFNKTVDVLCKLASESEADTHEKLRSSNPEKYHVATVVVSPLPLPTGDHLIVMPFYGSPLQAMMSWTSSVVAGPFIHRIARQLCTAIGFLHDHNMYHLDTKPQNLAIHEETGDLTVIDLGWVLSGRQPCYVRGFSGTYDYAPPEVKEWFEWEDPSPQPKRYNPRKADAWAIGNVIRITLETVSEYHEVTHYDELCSFASWMMKERPKMKEALERLEQIGQKSGARILESPIDSGLDSSSP